MYSAHLKSYPVSICQQLAVFQDAEQKELIAAPGSKTSTLLIALSRCEAPASTSQLSAYTRLHDVKGYLHYAVKRGLVEQQLVPGYQRRFLYKLTAQGELAVRQLLSHDSKNETQA